MRDYPIKFVTAAQAVQTVRSGDWVDYGFGAGFPELLDKALAARKGEVKDVKVRGGLVIRPRIEIVESDPEQESFTYYSWHIGDYERKLQSRGLVKFMPVMLRSLPYLYRDGHIRCDVAFVPVSKPDEEGYCGLGISPYAWRTIFESARTVIFRDQRALSEAARFRELDPRPPLRGGLCGRGRARAAAAAQLPRVERDRHRHRQAGGRADPGRRGALARRGRRAVHGGEDAI